ncbi:UNVERIFIED_CONTAM: hypothetical protein HDU68_012455 [Siphonaria sp. JEL0065]|nr:hypothetical protein HDU68_012455 [Siphonaria sp. JEL0065]
MNKHPQSAHPQQQPQHERLQKQIGPARLKILSAKLDAPCQEFNQFPEIVDLNAIAQELSKVISGYQAFWNAMDSVDNQAFVVDGLGRSSCKRKIALGDNCFLHFVLDPLHPTLIPSIRVSGPEAKSKPIECRLVKNRKHWNPRVTLLENLETMLEMKLPTKETPKDDVVECGICLAQLDASGMSANHSCENAQCTYYFHTNWYIPFRFLV